MKQTSRVAALTHNPIVQCQLCFVRKQLLRRKLLPSCWNSFMPVSFDTARLQYISEYIDFFVNTVKKKNPILIKKKTAFWPFQLDSLYSCPTLLCFLNFDYWIQHHKFFCFKKGTISRTALGTLSNILDGAFCGNSYRLLDCWQGSNTPHISGNLL